MQSANFKNLRDWRADGLCMTQGAVAETIDVTVATSYNWERGITMPPKYRLRETAAGYQLTVEELIRLMDGSKLKRLSGGWPPDYRHFRKKVSV